MRRRDFISFLCLTAVWPFALRAQQGRPIPRIGYLFGFGLDADAWFREGLREFGYVEGHNIIVEYRRASDLAQLDGLAAELIASKVEHLPCNVVRGHRGAQRLAAPCAGSKVEIIVCSGSQAQGRR
jgi:putative tryptophan/tyrosine transport system substrate-binding protein